VRGRSPRGLAAPRITARIVPITARCYPGRVKGALRIGGWRGVPVSIHWSAPIGFLLFFGFQVRPVGWLVLAAILLIHEWGHAVLVRRFGLMVYSIVLTGTGGECTWAGHARPTERAIIAWGGVLGQLPLLLVGLAGSALLHAKSPVLLLEATSTLVSVNLMLIGFNLLPIPGLDGWQAWRLFAPSNLRGLGTSARRVFLRRRARELEQEMADLIRNRKQR
jgi:Zn-dependent protease